MGSKWNQQSLFHYLIGWKKVPNIILFHKYIFLRLLKYERSSILGEIIIKRNFSKKQDKMLLKIFFIANLLTNRVYFRLRKNYKIYTNTKWCLFKSGSRSKSILKSLKVLKKTLEPLYHDSMRLFLKRYWIFYLH